MPIVFTSTSGGPTSAAIRSTTPRAAAGSTASATSRRMPSGSSFIASSLRSTPATVNPAAASFSAVTRPRSPPAPTTIATRSLIGYSSFRSPMDHVFRFAAGKVSGRHRFPVISGRSTVDTPTACPEAITR
jgi:hypothetical protein